MALERRTVLAGGVAATSMMALTACAAEPEPEVAKTTPPSATVEDTPEETSGELLLGTVDEIAVGSAKKFPIDGGKTILVTQPREGVFRAFDATCTHAGCIVNGVEGELIACGCHGARLDAESGEPVAGPAKSPLGPITLEVRGAELFATI